MRTYSYKNHFTIELVIVFSPLPQQIEIFKFKIVYILFTLTWKLELPGDKKEFKNPTNSPS